MTVVVATRKKNIQATDNGWKKEEEESLAYPVECQLPTLFYHEEIRGKWLKLGILHILVEKKLWMNSPDQHATLSVERYRSDVLHLQMLDHLKTAIDKKTIDDPKTLSSLAQ